MNILKPVLPIILIGTAQTAQADIIINEVMQSNVYTIMDDINEFPDSWMELHNTSDQAVSLDGYMVGTAKSADKAYVLPAVMVPPHGHVLVYCDKVGEKMHADFRIDSGKGDIYLFAPDGCQVDHVSLKKQPAPDVAYGRKSDGADKWGYQLSPSPAKANTGGTSDVVLGQVNFSQPGFVHRSRFNASIELEVPDNAPEGTYIIYTTDGSEPTLTNGTRYAGTEINVRKSTVIRAKAFCDGCISRPSNAQSYIFLGRDIKIPVISIAVDHKYLYDYRIGIFADGPGGQDHENYRYDWRRPINLEFFEGIEDVESSINQLCETRVQGGWTRVNRLKSLALYANKRFGEKRFKYEFWPKDKPGITDNKSFILRNGGNDFSWCYVRDGLMQRVIGRNTDIDWQGYSPAIVMINGEYHGMLAIRERSNEDNIAANYGGLEDIDMFENWWELKAGDYTAFNQLKEFIKSEHSIDEWAQVINIESFANLMAINYWVYNTDFPHNNTVMWRRTDGVDGRWQWLIKDCDFGLGIWNTEENLYKSQHKFQMTNSDPNMMGYDLYRALMKCPEFKQYYVDRLVVYMGDFLNARTFNSYLDEICAENEGEQQISHNKWGEWWSNLDGNIAFMRNWINKRGNYMPNLMKYDWGLQTAIDVKVNQDLSDDELAKLDIRYDGIALSTGRFDGKDYKGRTINLTGNENVGGWRIFFKGQETVIDGNTLSYDIAEVAPITINAIVNETGINDIAADSADAIRHDGQYVMCDSWMDAYDLSGRIVASAEGSLTLPARGIYIVKTADGHTAKITY